MEKRILWYWYDACICKSCVLELSQTRTFAHLEVGISNPSDSYFVEWTIWVFEFKNGSGLFIRTYKAVIMSMWGFEKAQASHTYFV